LREPDPTRRRGRSGFIGAARVDDAHSDVVQHLDGDFPGGVVDLHYRFTLSGALIIQLTIEP
jgi:hypothetical protein